MSDTTDIDQNDSTSFVVYVPPAVTPAKTTVDKGVTTIVTPASTDYSVESCLRLGASHADETTTYKDICNGADPFVQLSSSYQPNSGVALLTAGTINLTALQGVHTTAGSISSSTIGQSYSVTQDPDNNHIILASLSDQTYGEWATTNFTKAKTMTVNENLQGTFGLGANYTFSGGLGFSNGLSASFGSFVGIAVSAPISMNVTVGNNSVSTSWPFGGTFQYQDEASTVASKITLTVDSGTVNPKLALFTAKQNKAVLAMKAASIAIEAALAAYVVSAAVKADGGDPNDVKNWLKTVEGVTIACTTVNGLLCALGTILGIVQLVACKEPGLMATSVTVGDGTIELTTGKPTPATPLPTLNIDKTTGFSLQTGAKGLAPALAIVGGIDPVIALSMGDMIAPRLTLSKDSATLRGKIGKGKVTMDGSSLTLAFGQTTTITVDASGITITAGSNSVAVSSSGVTINGTALTINSPQMKIAPAPQPPPPKMPSRPPPPIPSSKPPNRAPPPIPTI